MIGYEYENEYDKDISGEKYSSGHLLIDIFLKIRQLPKELISNVNPLTAIFRNN